MERPNKAEHLAPFRWAKGQSGNPSGANRPKRLSAILRRLMAEQAADDPTRLVGERFWQEVVRLAIERCDVALIREILDRHDGRLPPPEPPLVEDMSTKSDEELIRIIKGGKRPGRG